MASHAGTDVAGELLMGAVAGAAAVWAMDRLDWFLMGQEPERARRQTRLARPDGQDPAHVIANRDARAVGARLSPGQPHPAGLAVHYGLGVMTGAAYAARRRRVGAVGAA